MGEQGGGGGDRGCVVRRRRVPATPGSSAARGVCCAAHLHNGAHRDGTRRLLHRLVCVVAWRGAGREQGEMEARGHPGGVKLAGCARCTVCAVVYQRAEEEGEARAPGEGEATAGAGTGGTPGAAARGPATGGEPAPACLRMWIHGLSSEEGLCPGAPTCVEVWEDKHVGAPRNLGLRLDLDARHCRVDGSVILNGPLDLLGDGGNGGNGGMRGAGGGVPAPLLAARRGGRHPGTPSPSPVDGHMRTQASARVCRHTDSTAHLEAGVRLLDCLHRIRHLRQGIWGSYAHTDLVILLRVPRSGQQANPRLPRVPPRLPGLPPKLAHVSPSPSPSPCPPAPTFCTSGPAPLPSVE